MIFDFVWVCELYFFFSSRRRHTRFDCDWSSDVCSSDLCDGYSRQAAGCGRDFGEGPRRRMERRGDRGGQPLNPVSRYFETAFAPDAPTARYIAGVKMIEARSGEPCTDDSDQLIASSLYATMPPCPTATNRLPKRMARRS